MSKKMWIMISFALILMIIPIILLNKSLNSTDDIENPDDIHGSIDFVSNRTDKSYELNELIKEFEKDYPDVDVNLELIGDLEEILERKAAVGELSDVTLVPSNIQKSEFSKYFLPLDDMGFSSDNMYNFSDGVSSDQSAYCLSTSCLWHGVIYNKEIFKSLGIDSYPRTENEFFEVCRKIKDAGIVPVALNYRQSWMMNLWIDTVPYLYNNSLEEKLIIDSKDIFSKDGEIKKSLDFPRQIYKSGYCEENIETYDWSQCKEDIINGKTAMIIWNSDFINQLVDLGMDKNKLGMFPIPESVDIKVCGDYKIGISKNTKYPAASKAFLKFLFEDDRYAKAVGIKSSLKDSKEVNEMMNEINGFNLPVIFDETSTESEVESKSMHEQYSYLKKCIRLDYNFIQNYITCEDTKTIEDESNKKWREYKSKY